MERLSSLVIPDYGLRTHDLKYLRVDSVVRGRGPNRLKYLDLEGRWILPGTCAPYISSAFNHLERLNDAKMPMRDMKEEPLNAIGLVGWTKSSVDAENVPAKPATLPRRSALRSRSPAIFEEPVKETPREPVPFRSAGYGDAHMRRKLSPPARSRSVSPMTHGEVSKRAEKFRDAGYMSSSPSPRDNDWTDPNRPPHRTQALSSRPSSRTRIHDTDYDPSYIYNSDNNRHYSDELRVTTGAGERRNRDGSRDIYREKRHYNISPRSIGSAGDEITVSGSDLDSPSTNFRERERKAEEASH